MTGGHKVIFLPSQAVFLAVCNREIEIGEKEWGEKVRERGEDERVGGWVRKRRALYRAVCLPQRPLLSPLVCMSESRNLVRT